MMYDIDLKPGNLLVRQNCDLKICDFGFARVENADEMPMTEHVVTVCQRYHTSIHHTSYIIHIVMLPPVDLFHPYLMISNVIYTLLLIIIIIVIIMIIIIVMIIIIINIIIIIIIIIIVVIIINCITQHTIHTAVVSRP